MLLENGSETAGLNKHFFEPHKFGKFLIKSGIIITIISFILFLVLFFPLVKEEFRYLFNNLFLRGNGSSAILYTHKQQSATDTKGSITPADMHFSVIIPKLGANSKIIENVDPYNSKEYQMKLTQGVAHAKGTAIPGEGGSTFLFAHSSDNFYNANRYNAVFYLLYKMTIGDKFYIVRDGTLFEYTTADAGIVEDTETKYLTENDNSSNAYLMTCWPPGTSNKRFLVTGELTNIYK